MIVDEKIPMPAPEEIDRAVEHIAEEGLGKGTAAGKKRLRTRLLMLGGITGRGSIRTAQTVL